MTAIHEINEKDLLRRTAAGDENAFRELVHYYNPLLAPYILQLTKSRERTEEIVQDIFVQVWTAREVLAKVEHFRRYLFVISKNHALNAIRGMIREEKRRMKWLQEQQYAAEETPLPDYSAYMSLVDEAVLQLPAQQQRVWIRCRREGKKYQEAAAEMGLSRETVKKYLHYASLAIVEYVQQRLVLALAGLLVSLFLKK